MREILWQNEGGAWYGLRRSDECISPIRYLMAILTTVSDAMPDRGNSEKMGDPGLRVMRIGCERLLA